MMYGDDIADGDDRDGDEDEGGDIENAISAEIGVIKTAKSTGLFKLIRPEIACGEYSIHFGLGDGS